MRHVLLIAILQLCTLSASGPAAVFMNEEEGVLASQETAALVPYRAVFPGELQPPRIERTNSLLSPAGTVSSLGIQLRPDLRVLTNPVDIHIRMLC